MAEKCSVVWPEGKYNARIHRAYPKKRRQANDSEIVSQDSPKSHVPPTPISTPYPAVVSDPEEAAAKRLDYSFKPYEARELRSLVTDVATGFSLSTRPVPYLQTLLPNTERIWQLVDYHELYLLWYHGCYRT